MFVPLFERLQLLELSGYQNNISYFTDSKPSLFVSLGDQYRNTVPCDLSPTSITLHNSKGSLH